MKRRSAVPLGFSWSEYLFRDRSLAVLEICPIAAMELRQYALGALGMVLVYLIYHSDAVALYIMRRRSFRDYLYMVLPACYAIVFGLSFVLDDDQLIWAALVCGVGPLLLRFALVKELAAQLVEANRQVEARKG